MCFKVNQPPEGQRAQSRVLPRERVAHPSPFLKCPLAPDGLRTSACGRPLGWTARGLLSGTRSLRGPPSVQLARAHREELSGGQDTRNIHTTGATEDPKLRQTALPRLELGRD